MYGAEDGSHGDAAAGGADSDGAADAADAGRVAADEGAGGDGGERGGGGGGCIGHAGTQVGVAVAIASRRIASLRRVVCVRPLCGVWGWVWLYCLGGWVCTC